ncbi:hypothetical protein [Bradyrhizobium sp. USDA 377]
MVASIPLLAHLRSRGTGRTLVAQAKIDDDFDATKSNALDHRDAGQPVPAIRDALDDASSPAPVSQDFRYLIYYVWSEYPPAEKPADIVLRSLKDTLVGTPIEEIKRASDAFGLDFNFMKAVAKIESGLDPKQRSGSLQGHYRRRAVRVGDAPEADLERSLLDPSTGLGRRRRAHQPT